MEFDAPGLVLRLHTQGGSNVSCLRQRSSILQEHSHGLLRASGEVQGLETIISLSGDSAPRVFMSLIFM